MSDSTLRLADTSRETARRASTWLVWSGLGSAAPLRLGPEELLLGRDATGPGRLAFPGVSRRHAELFRQGPLHAVRDLGSTNGTFLNGQKITTSALSDGDVLRLGDAVAVVTRLNDELAPPDTSEPLQGTIFPPGLKQVLQWIRRLAAQSLPVVIEGPTGVGKEGVARALHALSGRPGSLQAVNCGALPPSLAEAELFGYRKGAFTGAEQTSLGHVRAAHQGTLFLDELYDLPASVQSKLLRVLQEQQVTPLGETRPAAVDIRVVAASLVPLTELVSSGRLREDLAARLAGATIALPALTARRVDIAPLLAHFLRVHSGGRPPAVDGKLLEHLLLRPWAGNVRELELLVRRLLALHAGEATLRRSMVEVESLPTPEPACPSGPARVKRRAPDDAALDLSRLRERFAQHGNLTRAAREAGISRQRAYRLLAGRSASALVVDERDGDTEPAPASALRAEE